MRDVNDADALVSPATEGDSRAVNGEHWTPNAAGQLNEAALERPEGARIEPREARATVRPLREREHGRVADVPR